jgi:hypothetical protein
MGVVEPSGAQLPLWQLVQPPLLHSNIHLLLAMAAPGMFELGS